FVRVGTQLLQSSSVWKIHEGPSAAVSDCMQACASGLDPFLGRLQSPSRARRTAMKLYGFGPTRSLRALWGLKELDAEFEFVPINLLAGAHRRPDFLRLNPAGKVPVLVDGDLVLTESAAIVMYVADKYRDKGLLPADLKERAQAYRWIMFAVTELEQ